MKRSPRLFGFTLVELLTVIAIIAVLMGLLFPAIGSAKESARRAQAKNDCIQIVTAVKAYYTEYGKYPITSGAGSYTTSNSDVINELRNVNSTINPRQIVFLEVPEAKVSGAEARGGVSTSGNWVDPWGSTYRIAIDGDYDNQVSISGSTVYTGAAAWSLGKAKSESATSDHICSWQ